MNLKRSFIVLVMSSILAVSAHAATSATATVWSAPGRTVPGATLIANAAVKNTLTTGQNVKITLTLTGPCASMFPGKIATTFLSLRPQEVRTEAVSYRVPSNVCDGTYTLTVTVTDSSGTVIATHSTTIVIDRTPND